MPRARATTAAGLALLTAATAAISLAAAGPAQAATATYASATPVPIGGSHQVLHASGSIVINDGKASAYPIQTAEYVDGLAGTVTDVDLHLENFSHERPDDVDLMLVSPSGVASVVMSDVAAGGIPATDLDIVLDDEVGVAFLDVRPLFPGHTLLVPREHVETLADLPVESLGPYFERAQRLSRAMEEALGAAGSFVAINNRISQSVPHLHTHVVPRNPKDGLRGFFWPRTRYSDEAEAAAVAERLRAAVASGSGV